MVVTILALGVLLPMAGYGEDWVPGEIILKTVDPINIGGLDFIGGTGYPEIDELNEYYNVYEMTRLYDDELLFGGPVSHPHGLWDWGDWLEMVATYEFDTYYVFKYSAEEDPPEVAAAYEELEPVEIAEPSFIGEYDILPNDEYLGNQWYVHNTGQFDATAGCDIHAEEAWDLFRPPQQPEPILAIVDSGVNLDHLEFENLLVQGRDFGEGDPIPRDNDGHGTMVAGIAGARVNNEEGIASPGWVLSPGGTMNYFKMMPVKVSDADGEVVWKAVEGGILWAAKHGADAINMSIGTYSYSKTLEKACEGVYYLGVVMVGSKGNDHTEYNHYPSDFDTVIAVTATDWDDSVWWWSNYGEDTECAAPGWKMFTTTWYGWNTYTRPENDPEDWPNGTSLAAPLVSAACTVIANELLWDFDPPSAKVAAVRAILHRSCDNVNGGPEWDPFIGWGRLNLYKMALELRGEKAGTGGAVTVDGGVKGVASLKLAAPYPNPVSEVGTFNYYIQGTVTEPLTLAVYDLSGRKVDEVQFDCGGSGGTVEWNAVSARVPSGVYIARVEAAGTAAAVKFVVVR